MAEFPTRPEEVTPEWLTEALDYSGDAAIEHLSWQPIGTGQVGDSARFALEWSEPGTSPATLAGKFPAADETSRNTAALFGLYRKEVEFYRDFAPRLEVRVPRSHTACVDDEGAISYSCSKISGRHGAATSWKAARWKRRVTP